MKLSVPVPSLTADKVIGGRWMSAESCAIYLGTHAENGPVIVRRSGFPMSRWTDSAGVPHWDIVEVNDWAQHHPVPPPGPQATCLYRHLDAKGRLLYVGISMSVMRRVSQHSACSHWFREVASITLEWFPSLELALKAEAKAIAAEKPAHNVQGVRKL
jgi:predicted GIY-YIG superfamily endonuclease